MKLIGSLFGMLPIFAGVVLNTIAVGIAIAWREPSATFLAWLIIEVLLCIARLCVPVCRHGHELREQHHDEHDHGLGEHERKHAPPHPC
ncbi:hypothetical protein [Cupriavidus basilensis]|uniref:Uncharacterized protein n=1 Tax=Cupriavidus basilensis TaxID=68895 RepID=A0A643FKW4_9BURK|nr:hypothetical protein F7R26_032720 [Cupriavidus basilensis]